MPYITTERVAEIRAQIKKEFPSQHGWKFSITREHYSSVNVAILCAPFPMLTNKEGRTYEQVNEYYIHEYYADTPEIMKVLQRLRQIMNEGNGILVEDSDYGTVPNFYLNISIGSWNKPFNFDKTKAQKINLDSPALNTVEQSFTPKQLAC